MDGIITELQNQIEALREEIASKNSIIGALKNDVLLPLETELASVKAELAKAQAQVAAPPQVVSFYLEGGVIYADGRQQVGLPVTLAPGLPRVGLPAAPRTIKGGK